MANPNDLLNKDIPSLMQLLRLAMKIGADAAVAGIEKFDHPPKPSDTINHVAMEKLIGFHSVTLEFAINTNELFFCIEIGAGPVLYNAKSSLTLIANFNARDMLVWSIMDFLDQHDYPAGFATLCNGIQTAYGGAPFPSERAALDTVREMLRYYASL